MMSDYEYVVVGSGAGGGPLAANLAKSGHTVLLLEAGGAEEPYNYQVPVFHALSTEDEALQWEYFVRHYGDDQRQQRDSKFTPEKDGVLYPRAGTLGGCTAHNAMITVYPHNSDWDRIAELTGDPSWNSRRMRRYFQRLEACTYRPVLKFFSRLGWNPSRHGFRGWLTTSAANPLLVLRDHALLELLSKAVFEAFKELGDPLGRLKRAVKSLLDPNDWRLVKRSTTGVRIAPLATRDGRRNGTREYIREVERASSDKLKVKTNALVTRVLFDDAQTAIGVEYRDGAHLYRADPNAQPGDAPGPTTTVRVTREVILAAGAFNTPQLLMLSGIGPKAELERHGIEVRVDRPGVGANLQDRYEVALVYRMKKDFALLEGATYQGPPPGETSTDPHFLEWEKGKGVYTTNGAVISIIKRSAPDRPEPDLFVFGLAGKFRGYFPGYSQEVIRYKNYFTWAVLKAHTRNTGGKVSLRSADPRDVPDINFRYFDEGTDTDCVDLESVVDGVEFIRDLMARTGDIVAAEETPGPDVHSRKEIRRFVEDEAWGHHASCSCKMGRSDDPMAVVDGDFRVYGTRNLRIVDASVFPWIPGFFIVSSIYMISEKASDVILADACN